MTDGDKSYGENKAVKGDGEHRGRGAGVEREAHVEVITEYRPRGEERINHENIWHMQRS